MTLDENTLRDFYLTCTMCGQSKPPQAFSKATARPTGYYSWCKDCVSAHEKKPEVRKRRYGDRNRWHAENQEKALLMRARGRAKERGLSFDLELSDIVIPERCPILDIPLIRNSDPNNPNNPSLDRIDNTKGYVKGNVIVISLRANKLKNDATLDELRRIVEWLEKLL